MSGVKPVNLTPGQEVDKFLLLPYFLEEPIRKRVDFLLIFPYFSSFSSSAFFVFLFLFLLFHLYLPWYSCFPFSPPLLAPSILFSSSSFPAFYAFLFLFLYLLLFLFIVLPPYLLLLLLHSSIPLHLHFVVVLLSILI